MPRCAASSRAAVGPGGSRAAARRGTTMRETRRIRSLMTARLGSLKTLDGFDFTFQPSLDRNRILALAGSPYRPQGVVHLLGRQEPARPTATARWRQAVKAGKRLLRHPGHRPSLARRSARPAQGRIRFIARNAPADRRRDRLSAGHRRWRLFFQLVAPVRTRRRGPHLKPRLRRMGRHLRRPGRRYSLARSPAAPRPGRADRGLQLSPSRARRPRARQSQGQVCRHPLAGTAPPPARAASKGASTAIANAAGTHTRTWGFLLRHKWGKFRRH